MEGTTDALAPAEAPVQAPDVGAGKEQEAAPAGACAVEDPGGQAAAPAAPAKPPAADPSLLGLSGVTINSMALIAPGAFLWTTYGINLGCIDSNGDSFARDTFVGIIFAVWVAFMTAFPFAELARVYPEAGAGGAYYFAERSFRHCRYQFFRPWSQFMKWYMGYAIHLFYWVYPGVTTALMAQVIVYLISTSPSRAGGDTISGGAAAALVVLCAGLVAAVAVKGVNFSTKFNTGVVAMQSAAIALYGVLWAAFRAANGAGPPAVAARPASVATAAVAPGGRWLFDTPGDIFRVHSFLGMLYQSSIAILILVGFDSSTQLGAETRRPERNVAYGCVLSLALQALLSYPFSYVTASAAMPASFQSAASLAPIGDLTMVAANWFLPGSGYPLMVLQAVTVLLSIFGTTLAASNAAVRVSLFMATERQFPAFMARLHASWRTPYVGILLSFGVNCALGAACVAGATPYANAVATTAITMASNVGTFLLYAGICLTTLVNFAGKPTFHWWRHGLVPAVGCLLNLAEIAVIFAVAIANERLPYPQDASAKAAYLALAIAAGWLAVYAAVLWGGRRGWYGRVGLSPNEVSDLDNWSIRAQSLNALPTAVPGFEHANPEDEWSIREPGGSLSKMRRPLLRPGESLASALAALGGAARRAVRPSGAPSNAAAEPTFHTLEEPAAPPDRPPSAAAAAEGGPRPGP